MGLWANMKAGKKPVAATIPAATAREKILSAWRACADLWAPVEATGQGDQAWVRCKAKHGEAIRQAEESIDAAASGGGEEALTSACAGLVQAWRTAIEGWEKGGRNG